MQHLHFSAAVFSLSTGRSSCHQSACQQLNLKYCKNSTSLNTEATIKIQTVLECQPLALAYEPNLYFQLVATYVVFVCLSGWGWPGTAAARENRAACTSIVQPLWILHAGVETEICVGCPRILWIILSSPQVVPNRFKCADHSFDFQFPSLLAILLCSGGKYSFTLLKIAENKVTLFP